MVEKDFGWYLRRKFLQRRPFLSKVSPRYMEKARTNLVTMRILWEIIENKTARDALSVPYDYDPGEWVVVTAYYSMYMAALSLLARVDVKSSNHTATVVALETLFVKKRLLEPVYLRMLRQAHLEMDQVENLANAKMRREVAQYSVSKTTTRMMADAQRKNADAFVTRMRELLMMLGTSQDQLKR